MARRVMLSGAVPSGVTASNSQPTGGAGCGESASCATAPNRSGGDRPGQERRVRIATAPGVGFSITNHSQLQTILNYKPFSITNHSQLQTILNYKPFSNSHPRRQIILIAVSLYFYWRKVKKSLDKCFDL